MSDDNTQAPVRAGETIAGKYVVERVLGVGGMGVVVAARHVELGELFALKFLLPNVGANAEVTRRFAREARTGIRVKNEHVARVYDVGTLPDGAPYMVMEHLTGEDLATLIERRGFLPVSEAIDLLLQACEALCEAHQIGIVHRDLKPANLFVIAGSDGLPFVKVLDFGISKHIQGGEDLSVTSSAAILGSPLYMSPEQLRSSKDVDRRSDIWSLGVILFEAVTGATPFEGESFPALCVAIMTGKFQRASALRAGIPPELDAILTSALQIDRDGRLSSVEEFARRLAPFGTAAARTSSERIVRIAARGPASSGALPEPSPSRPSLNDEAETRSLRLEPDPPVPPAKVETNVPGPAVAAPRRGGAATLVAVGVVMMGVGVALVWAIFRGPAPTPPHSHSEPEVTAVIEPTEAPVLAQAPVDAQAASENAPLPSASAASASVGLPAPHVDVAPAPSVAAGGSRSSAGGSGIAALTRAFKRREADVSKCIEGAPDLPGVRISIRFTLGVDGHVKAAEALPPEVGLTPLGQCLVGVARGTDFGPQATELSFRIPIATRHGS